MLKKPFRILLVTLLIASSCSVTPYYHGAKEGAYLVPVEIPDTLLPEISEKTVEKIKNAKLSPTETRYIEKEEKKLGIRIPDGRREIARWIKYYSKNPFGRRWIEKSVERGAPYLPIIREKLRKAGLPEELAYLPIIESGFKPLARSRAGAVGIWQFIPGSARKFGLKVDWWIDQRRDPIKSTDAAVKYLKELYKIFGKWDLALSAYNYGEGKLKRKIKRYRTDNFWRLKRRLPRETRNYVPQFFAVLTILSDPDRYGIKLPSRYDPFVYDSVKIPYPVSLDVAAKWAGVPLREMIRLNLEFKRGLAPPYYRDYYLRIPIGTKEAFVSAMESTPRSRWYTVTYHRVRRGENLISIARKYHVSARELARVNRISNPRKLRPGKVLIIPMSSGYARYINENVDIKIVNKYGKTRVVKYRVKKGDNLRKISRKFGVSVSNLKKWNNLKSSRLKPGQMIIVYKAGEERVLGQPKYLKYRVKKGDTLYAISEKFKVDVDDIMRINGIKNPRQLKPGMVVKIPSGT